MTMYEMANAIGTWFGRAKDAGIVLPDGWFGRPYDSFYRLEEVSVNDSRLAIRLDESTSLVFEAPARVLVEDSELVIECFKTLKFTSSYDNGTKVYSREYDYGQVRLVPRIGTTVDFKLPTAE